MRGANLPFRIGPYELVEEFDRKHAGKSFPAKLKRDGKHDFFGKGLDAPRAVAAKRPKNDAFIKHQQSLYKAISASRVAAKAEDVICKHEDFLIEEPFFFSVYEWVDLRLLDIKKWRSDPEYNLDFRCGLLRDGARALAAFHRHNLVHGDVKFTNFLYFKPSKTDKKWHAKLADYDDAFFTGQPQASGREFECTMDQSYASPEQWANFQDPCAHTARALTAKTDVFSFGVTAIEILSGDLPKWEASTKDYVGLAVADRAKLHWSRRGIHADEAARLERFWPIVERCLSLNAVARPTMEEVQAELDVLSAKRSSKGGYVGAKPQTRRPIFDPTLASTLGRNDTQPAEPKEKRRPRFQPPNSGPV